MAVNLFRTLSPDFSQPLGMLAACHGRIEGQCETLLRLVSHMKDHGVDEQARQAAQNIMRYFDTAGRHHHEDEEKDLFPRLLSLVREEDKDDARALVSRLEQDHRAMEQAWRELRESLERMARGEAIELTDALVRWFSELYADHIELEEAHLFPLATKLLSHEDVEALGTSMAKRRGVRL